MDDRAFASATWLSDEIRDRRIGCVELLDFYLARAEWRNPLLNAIVVWQVEQARERARAADAALAHGDHRRRRGRRLHPDELTTAWPAFATRLGRTRWWRGQSGANSSLKPNSLLAGKIQGISSILALVTCICRRNGHYNQCFTSKFPTQRNRELIRPYQGIKSAYQGNIRPDQGRTSLARV